VISQLLPERLADFVRPYEKPKNRRVVEHGSYVIEDYLQNLATRNAIGETIVGPASAIPQFYQQLNILRSVERRFESSLFDIRQMVQADIFDSELDAARELLKNKFERAAGAVAGVVLEKHLLGVCQAHKIQVKKKNPGINDLIGLLKEKEVVDIPRWRFVQHLADLRNLCDHNKDREPTRDEVHDLIEGTEKITKTLY